MMVITVQILNGKFSINDGKNDRVSCALTAEALCTLLLRAGYDPENDAHILMCGSSMDFPEDDGAPKNFPARETLYEAVKLLRKRAN